jgi:hypothetical protein
MGGLLSHPFEGPAFGGCVDDQEVQRLGEALYVGQILVEISENMIGGYSATTANDDVLGFVELGFEISTTVYDDDDAEREPADMLREVIDQMRLALARCLIFGRMSLMGEHLDAEDWQVVEKVRDALPAGYLEITPTLTAEACVRQEERDAAIGAFLESMVEAIEAQQQHPDENITWREAAERQKKRSEEIRRIVEGEEEE